MQIFSSKLVTSTRPSKLAIALLSVSGMFFSSFIYAQQEPTADAAAAVEQSSRDGHHQRHKQGKHDKHGKRDHHEKKAEMMMTKIDANADGQVDLNEFLSHSEERFHAMDVNGDGFITDDERRESHKIMRKKHEEARAKGREAFEKAMDEWAKP